ncbi:hypothetical protein K438DRAFT_668297 [Mycena galopus ATCC 62051]|nr:hypothetical protein K438DRAFT_668297 [Mycena galopus ATCC 62051]
MGPALVFGTGDGGGDGFLAPFAESRFLFLWSLDPPAEIISHSASVSSSNTLPSLVMPGVCGAAENDGNGTSRGVSNEAWRFVKDELRWGGAGRFSAAVVVVPERLSEYFVMGAHGDPRGICISPQDSPFRSLVFVLSSLAGIFSSCRDSSFRFVVVVDAIRKLFVSALSWILEVTDVIEYNPQRRLHPAAVSFVRFISGEQQLRITREMCLDGPRRKIYRSLYIFSHE